MSQVLQFKPRQPTPVQPASARQAQQAPVLRLAYTDQFGRPQHATLSSTGRLAGISEDPMVQEIFLQALGAALAVCGGRLCAAQSVSSACMELDCSHLYDEPSEPTHHVLFGYPESTAARA